MKLVDEAKEQFLIEKKQVNDIVDRINDEENKKA